MAQQFEHQLNQHGIPYTKTYENANTHIIENDVIKSKTGNAMQNESISIMAILISKVITLQLQIYKVHFQ